MEKLKKIVDELGKAEKRMKTIPVPVRLSPLDIKKIEEIKNFYGLHCNAEAIRFSISKTARELEKK